MCTYTASNAAKFYFDDFYAGPILGDTSPPALESVQVLSPTEMMLIFSEALDPAGELISHYWVDQNVGPPQTAVLQPDAKSITLTFDQPFINGFQYQLTVAGIKDLFGNTTPSSQFSFQFFVAFPIHSKDIVITEFFPDFNPRIGLPDAEYIEIYNRSTNPIDLSGCPYAHE